MNNFGSFGGFGSTTSLGGMGGAAGGAGGGKGDFEIVQPQQLNGQPDALMDGISSLSFSPAADFLAASSWDGLVRCWQVGGETSLKAAISHQSPALSCCWSADGSKLFSGSADKQAKMLDLSSGQQLQVAQHDAPISAVRFCASPQAQLLVTASWDKTIKYWDLRSSQPALTVNLPERCYAMDVRFPISVVCTAERKILIYNLNNPSVPFKEMESPLKHQTRCVSCFSVGDGFAIGSIEGRVGIQYIHEKDSQNTFSFKCHREKDGASVFPVNAISFHPTYGTFSTAGSDGTFNFWDKDSKQRLKNFPKMSTSISATAFNRNGSIFAYAVSYDWSKGYEGYSPSQMKNSIFLHAVTDEEIKPRPKQGTRWCSSSNLFTRIQGVQSRPQPQTIQLN